MNLKAISLTTLALLPASVLAACGSTDTTASVSSSASGTTPVQGTTPSEAPNGQMPAGMGTVVTGSAATKASNAATAKYPGTVERVMKLDDGSYVVHVTTSSGEKHVKVSSAFKVTGLETMPSMPNGSQAPQGTTPPSGATTSSSTTQ